MSAYYGCNRNAVEAAIKCTIKTAINIYIYILKMIIDYSECNYFFLSVLYRLLQNSIFSFLFLRVMMTVLSLSNIFNQK